MGRSSEAETAYSEALARQKDLAAEFPTRPEFRRDVAIRESRLGADHVVWGTDAVHGCSVCTGPVDHELRQVWISSRVGTDVLPLLVNACSAAYVAALPEPYPGYVPTPHTGGPDVAQPPPSGIATAGRHRGFCR